ncbi:MAG: VacJ family lipoprotein [Alphaproteobacteria bacterium]|nr:VacJ family lipoprotein [Alphaproteobacteria bacterium]
MKNIALCLSLLCGYAIAEADKKQIPVQPYSEKEIQEVLDKDLKRFAKEKHGGIITVKEEPVDEYGDTTTAYGYDDPLEPLNRVVFNFIGALDIMVFEPLAHIYRNLTPNLVKSGFDNFMTNLSSPLYAVNHMLQGEMGAFFDTTMCFVINTLFGGVGLVDMAEGFGLQNKRAWFGQTLATWGMESGPYLVLPLFGSSTFRGAFGTAGEFMINPVSMIVNNDKRHGNRHKQQRNLYMALWGIQIISEREKVIEFLEDLQKNSLDIYVSMRDITYQQDQKMEAEIKARS